MRGTQRTLTQVVRRARKSRIVSETSDANSLGAHVMNFSEVGQVAALNRMRTVLSVPRAIAAPRSILDYRADRPSEAALEGV